MRSRCNISIATVHEHNMSIRIMRLDYLRVLRADWLACYHRRGAQDGKQVLFHRVAHKNINSCGPLVPVQRPATFCLARIGNGQSTGIISPLRAHGNQTNPDESREKTPENMPRNSSHIPQNCLKPPKSIKWT